MASPSTTPILPLFARLTWMFVGPMALLLFTFAIVSKGGGWLTGFDIGFGIVLAFMLTSRWLALRAGHPEKATGEPATPRDLHRYVLVTATIGVVTWTVANLWGNYGGMD
jgi:hypothetical protein